MKLLLLGKNGQLGKALQPCLSSVGELKACDRHDVDLTDVSAIQEAIKTFQPDCIVNAAGYTAVDKAESEPELAFKVNAEAVAAMANAAKRHDAWLVHYSTDYVFCGSQSEPYSEKDSPNPINVYGQSKLAGEEAIKNSGCKHFIFRTAWVIGRYGNNFVKTILRLAQERDTLGVVNDQHGVPTTTHLIAKVTVAAIESIKSSPWPIGLYHLVPQGQTTWYEIAKILIDLAQDQNLRCLTEKLSLYPINALEYPTAALRPSNSRLNTSKLEQLLSFNLPHWKYDFCKIANEIIKEFKVA